LLSTEHVLDASPNLALLVVRVRSCAIESTSRNDRATISDR
jgi:hypothetical protein